MTEWDKKREVMQHYDHSATVYDAQYSEEQKAKINAALSGMNLEGDSLVLDTGCGTGLLFDHIRNRVKLLVGIDISPRILKEAERRAKRFPTALILRADADHTPFPNETFDTVFAITLLQNMPNPQTTLHEMKRVSKNHAIIAVTGLKKEFTKEGFKKLLDAAGLKTSIIKANDQLKGHVAICRKRREKT
ncbi:MAG: hypothetical protein AOA65_0582 [Candidatus Bathyarchaeota archaeon BA1]|nr:MAG: hypothetical protein AOA65_0582 [Candidatus Bathyarchaeota archaeon BA1]